jgi:hypothetical protein
MQPSGCTSSDEEDEEMAMRELRERWRCERR